MRYYHFNVEYLNWWWRYRVGYRDPKAGQITIYGHHYKCANFHHFPMFPSWGCHRAPWAKNNNNNNKTYNYNRGYSSLVLAPNKRPLLTMKRFIKEDNIYNS